VTARAPARRRSVSVVLAAVAGCLAALIVGGVDDRVVAAPVDGTTTARFEAVGPVRLADTRESDCGCAVAGDGTVRVQVTGRPGVPATAVAAAVTLTAVGGDRAAFVTAWPAGSVRPSTSLANVGVRQVVANSGIVPLSADGAIDLWANTPTNLVVDVTGVFVAASSGSAGRFVAITPDRVLDTRGGTSFVAGERRVVPRPAAVPADASAWVVNLTSVGAPAAGFVTAFAAGGGVPTSSVLNPDGSGAAVAASVIVPASAGGVELFSSSPTHLVADVTGWFTGESAPHTTDGLFVPTAPTRLLDTRTQGPRLWGDGDRELTVPVVGAAALVTNLTVVEPDARLFVTARAAGTPMPPTSSVNAASRGAVVANAAITAVSDRGLAWYSNVGTDLVVDMTGWFTGTSVTATEPPRPNVPRTVSVLLIGDSTLAALEVVTASQRALQGASFVVDAAPCRRLLLPSCKSAFTLRVPTTAVEAIRAAAVAPEVLVVKAGYNEGSSAFRDSVVAVLSAARSRGVRTVVWLTYSEGTRGQLRTYELNNTVLRGLRDSGAWPELVLADWRTYAASSSGWYSADRVHLQGTGAWATSDYIARWVAHVTHRPCPQPWTPGEAVDDRCANPDTVAATRGTPALRSLYGF
jgi:hypothetical protein